jgi:hypothetical protein
MQSRPRRSKQAKKSRAVSARTLSRRPVRNIAPGRDSSTRYYGDNPFPPVLQATLKYSDITSLTASGSTVAPYVFKINSCYDPASTITGHQPRLFDQFCNANGPYLAYRVVGFRIRGEIQNTFSTAGAQSYNAVVAWGPSLSSTAPTIPAGSNSSIATYAEIPQWKTCLSSIVPCKFSSAFRIADIIGHSEQTVQDDITLQAPYSADPTKLVYFQVQIQQTQGSVGGANTFYVDMTYDIEFDVQFENRLIVPPS